MKDNQSKRVWDYIDSGKAITRLEAYEKLGIFELPKRISELRQAGYPIGDTWIRVINRYGEKTRVKAYFKIDEENEEQC